MALTRITQGVIKPNENYDTHNINSTGIVTATGLNISGNASIGGVLTYEDVTNIDSIGIITARSDIKVGTAVTITSAGAGFYAGIVTASNFVKSDGSTFGASSNEYYLKHIDSSGNASANGGNMFGGYRAGGQSATGNITSGEHNHAIGWECGEEITSGNYNTLYGYLAGTNIRNGNANVAMGYETLLDIRQNHGNVALGSNALRNLNGYGDYNFNVAIGYYALREANQAERNVGVGQGVGASLSNGDRNTFLGTQAGGTGTNNITTGSNNILLGNQAQATSATVSNEVTIGNSNINHLRVPGIGVSFSAGGAVISGIVTATNFAKADGSPLGGVTSDAQENTVGGTNAGNALTSNSVSNTLFGSQSGRLVDTGDRNTAIGRYSLYTATSSTDNVAIGYNSLYATTANNNTAIGSYAGKNINSGDGNTLIGYQSGQNIQTSVKNVAIGKGTLNGVVSGYGNNISIGERSMFSCGSNVDNLIAIGYEALKSHQGSTNSIAIGTDALETSTTGRNIGIGKDAGTNVSDGSQNTILGYRAGDILTSGDNNIIIGDDADPSSATVSNEITLGNTSVTKFRIPGLSISIDSTGISDAKGNLRSIPQQNEQGSTHTLVAADAGKHILADNTVTVPPTSGIFSAGDAITIVNAGSSDISIAKGSGVTMYNSADGSDAGRTLAAKGMATILCGGSNTYYISGAGLS